VTRARERGSATIWVIACCALLMVVAGAGTVRGLAVLARHRAESGADLAALAAAAAVGTSARPCSWAARVAADNGGRLRRCRVALGPDGRSGTADISVAVGLTLPWVGRQEVLASARAARLPP
jgi:secretion/DNA translocation related TadE-like protein